KESDSRETRDRSLIVFPYGDLEGAVEIARGVNGCGGNVCDWDQLAAHFGQVGSGGGFRNRVATAKIFGLVNYSQGKVTLLPLGASIIDPQQEARARAEAFLTVPLYKSLFDSFRGRPLPPISGLEAEMVRLGVAEKQKDKARQVFQRSANQAGFFW